MAKTLFNSSEKSNFILNMTEEKYSSLAAKALAVTCFAVSAFAIPAELSSEIGFSIISGGLAVAGVICLILALIAVIKKYVDKKMLVPVIAFAAMLLWGIISMINSYDTTVSFYGFDGRGEGLLALIFYFGFFITGLTVKRERALSTLLNCIIGVGLLNCVWGLLQVFVPDFPSSYSYIIVSGQINAASGLAQSPLSLAMLLSLSLTAAVLGFILSDKKARKIFCIICTVIFSFTIICTYSLVGIIGIVFAVISAAAAVFITKAPKIKLASALAVVLSAALAVVLVNVGVIGDSKAYKLHDGPILWTDSFNRLASSGLYDPAEVEIESTADVYSFLFSETFDIIKDYPLAGSGPDQLVYPQLYKSAEIYENTGTFDRCCNEYLYTAATRGIPSLIALAVLLISLVRLSAKKLRDNRNYAAVSLFMLLICGVVLFLAGGSSITFSPVFWAAAGASCASMTTDKSSKGKKMSK